MNLSADVRFAPGLFNAGNALCEDRPYDGALADFLDTPGIADTGLAAEVQDVANTVAEQAADYADEGIQWNALRDGLRRLFRQEHHTSVGSTQEPIELGSYWMTLPDVPGASVEINISGGQSTTTSATLTIAGIGGGGEWTIDLHQALSHKTTHCEKVLVTAMATFERIEVTRHSKLITTYSRLVAIDKDIQGWEFRRETPPSSPGGLNGKPRTFKITDSDGSTTVSVGIDRKTTWNTSVGLTLPNLGGINANISTKLTYESGFQLANELPPGRTYVASLYKDVPAYIWTVQT